MKIALYKDQMIHLTKIERDQLQKIFLASQRGELSCPCCHQSVKLKISIHEPPLFIHPSQTFNCDEAIKALEEKHEATVNHSVGSFTLPSKREINGGVAMLHKTNDTVTGWKNPYEIRSIPPFKNHQTSSSEHKKYDVDDSQWEAISTTEGPLLVLAGAGSGKTRVLTTRTAYMLTEKKIASNRLLLVTFTTKAAKEMKKRMASFSGITERDLQTLVVGTFHSIFYKMLMHHQGALWQPNKLLKSDWQREQIIKEASRELGIDEKEFAFDQALSQISYWKNHILKPSKVRAETDWDEKVKILYERYEQTKQATQHFDFDDMLLGCYELLIDNASLLEKYQQRFSYILVDEFQDINKVQYEIISLLAKKTQNLCVVGDDDQSIYSFRGSDPSYILNFETDFPKAKIVTLNCNYRSHHSIVSSATNVITNNKKRKTKKVVAMTENMKRPLQFYPFDEEEEATMIVTDIKEKIENGARPRDFVILYRTNSSARAIFERLVASSLPFYLEQDGEAFYRRRTVRKALAYLKLSLYPDDQEAIKELLGAMFIKQSSLRDLKALSILHDCSLLEAMTKLTDIQVFQQKKIKKMIPLFKQLRNFSAVEALEWVEKEMGLSDYIKKNGNEGNVIDKGSDDLRDLKVAAASHDRVSDFLIHVDHMIAKSKELKGRPENEDSIQLMTVHRAKGLEFKTVYILSAVEGSLPHDYSLEAYREGDLTPLEEERRLMYVAVTRAMENLYISIPQKRRGKRAHPSRFIREMNTMI
ncbi:ATP-dependent DNA helicase Rep [Anaerobacillus arseniciselenatis]|uniref:DNA 3'-5' helicase n=1 Tax=Anaerobacillus arseniciselenatis TaxID=85682 RepID=A0A1S2LC83_9BACI|nr:ATP-dependent helicase [Anaerobacillus arseniciselenatis]OIJ10102.1 ATP-dependent DNA helicase Rep [Anaerobacillus arseniciselenatis]